MADTKCLRERLGMTQKEFSEFFKIPLATVKNWDARFCMPDYVFNIINICTGYKELCELYEQKYIERK